jgi:hypothetical protein
LAPPLTCCWGRGTGGECFVGDKPPLGGGSGEDPDAAWSDLASRDCAGVRCDKPIDGEDVMLLLFSAENEDAGPFEGTGADVDVFVGGEGGR